MDTNQLQLENEKLNARLEKAKEVFKQQAADIKAKEAAYSLLTDEYNKLIKERDTFAQDNVKLNEQISELEVQKQSISDMHNKTATALKMRDNEIEELRKNIAKFEEGNSKHDDLQEELNTTKKELHIANETITEYASKCTRYDEVIKSLNEKNGELEETINHNNIELNSNSDKIKQLNTTIERIYTEFSNLVKKYNNIVSDKDKLVSDNDALILGHKEPQDTYNNLVIERDIYNDIQTLKYIIEQLKKDIEDKNAQLTDACTKVSNLTKQLEKESGKVEEVKTKTEAAVTSIKKKLQTLNDGLGDEFNIFG